MAKQNNNPIFLFAIVFGLIFEYSINFTILSKLFTIGFECGKTIIYKRSTVCISELENNAWLSFVVDFLGPFKLEPRIPVTELSFDGFFDFQDFLFSVDFSRYVVK